MFVQPKLFSRFFILFSFFQLSAQTPDLSWLRQFEGPQMSKVVDIEVSDNDVYALVTFYESCDLDPGPGSFSVNASGGSDLAICKFDLQGNFIWAKTIGSAANEFPSSIVVDRRKNVLVAGCFRMKMDFNPGPGVDTLKHKSNWSKFLLKLDSMGNYVWAREFGGSNVQDLPVVRTNTDGSYVLAGFFGGVADFDPGPNYSPLVPQYSFDAFVLSLDSAGIFQWVKQLSSTFNMYHRGLDTDPTGNIYLTGEFSGTCDLNPGPATHTFTSDSTFSYSSYVLKLDKKGNFVAGKKIGGIAETIRVTKSGNVYVGGSYMAGQDMDPGAGIYYLTHNNFYDCFILKLDNTLNFTWAKGVGSNGMDEIADMLVNTNEDVYVTGYYGAVMDFDPGPSIYSQSCQSAQDGFVLLLNSSGDFRWAGTIQNSSGSITAVALDKDENLYLGGFFQGQNVDFDPGPATHFSSSTGNVDGFVLKHKDLKVVGLEENPVEDAGRLFPNPFREVLYVNGSKAGNKLQLYDAQGRMLYDVKINDETYQLHTNDLAPGFYTVRIINAQQSRTFKVVKN